VSTRSAARKLQIAYYLTFDCKVTNIHANNKEKTPFSDEMGVKYHFDAVQNHDFIHPKSDNCTPKRLFPLSVSLKRCTFAGKKRISLESAMNLNQLLKE
jgi:hypothetical protein